MMQEQEISKTEFKMRALEIMRMVEQDNISVVITDRGKPTLEIKKLKRNNLTPLELLKNTVVLYENPTDPVADDDWENA